MSFTRSSNCAANCKICIEVSLKCISHLFTSLPPPLQRATKAQHTITLTQLQSKRSFAVFGTPLVVVVVIALQLLPALLLALLIFCGQTATATTLLLPPHSSTIQLSCFCLCAEIEFSPTKRGLRGLCPLPLSLSLLWSLPAVRQVKITWALICATVDMFVSLSVCLLFTLAVSFEVSTQTQTHAHVCLFVCSHVVCVVFYFGLQSLNYAASAMLLWIEY